MEGGSERIQKNRKTKTKVEQCYKKRHEGERSTERRRTILENMYYENLMSRPQTGESVRRKECIHKYESNVLPHSNTRHVRYTKCEEEGMYT